VQGSLTTPEGLELTPGDVMFSRPRGYYGTNIAGQDGALTAEIFSSAFANTTFAVPDDPDLARLLERVNADMDAARADREKSISRLT
jgi:hypothetical protein